MRLIQLLSTITTVCAAVLKPQEASGTETSTSVIPSLTGNSFKSTTLKGSWFVKFFSPSCPHCVALAPYWEKAGVKYESLADTHDFHLASVDCTINGDLCHSESIAGYPTLFLYKDGVKIDEYPNIGSPDPLVPISSFIEKHAPKSFPDEPIDDSRVMRTKTPEVKQSKPTPKVAAGPDFVKGSKIDVKEAKPQATPVTDADKSAGLSDMLSSNVVSETAKKAIPLLSSDFSRDKQAILANPTGTSVNLTPDSFTKLVTNTQDGWFIKFYAPWCNHCKAMAPAWNELAHDYQGKLNIGEVNCEEENRLCKDINIHGYPTLLFFQGQEHIEYSGLRGLGDLMAFAAKAATASIKDVDAAEFEAIKKKEEVIFLYFYDSATTSEDLEALQRTSLELIGHAPLLKTSSSILASQFRATTFPKLMVIRDDKPQYYNALGPADMRDHKKILAWMRTAWLPMVPELSAENSHEIMDNRIVVLSVLDPDSPDFDKHRSVVKDAAHTYNDQRAAEEQAEKQTLRDKKQTKIDDATKKGDTRAIQSAKDIRVKISDHQEVGFAWVNGLFWEKWLAAAYSLDVSTTGARIIINNENKKQYWDTDAKGHQIAIDKIAILDILNTITQTPSKIPPKSTKNTLEAAYYAARRAGTGHPYLLACLSVGLLAAILLILTRGGKKKHSVSIGNSDRERGSHFAGNGKFD